MTVMFISLCKSKRINLVHSLSRSWIGVHIQQVNERTLSILKAVRYKSLNQRPLCCVSSRFLCSSLSLRRCLSSYGPDPTYDSGFPILTTTSFPFVSGCEVASLGNPRYARGEGQNVFKEELGERWVGEPKLSAQLVCLTYPPHSEIKSDLVIFL